MEKKKIIFYTITGLAILFGLFFLFKSDKIKTELEHTKAKQAKLESELIGFKHLLGIDTTLVSGNYNDALKAYNIFLNDANGQDSVGTGLRIELAKKLIQLRVRATALDTITEKQPDSVDARGDALAAEIRQYDAVSFELEKARVQLAQMKRQLKERSQGEYLSFKSQKGNQMHYVGAVKNNQAHGFGVALLDTGSRYEGEWKNNARHGEGAFYWPDGEYYIGSYANDQRNGLGTYYWPNGEKYIGQWKDDKRNGQGTFFGKDGEAVTSGLWKDDKLVEKEKDRKEKK